ncbi:MAG: polyprenyl synthetase family protein [Ignavibacteria bacterium]|nr:polyprenyl synthetase family protein [Ignavibacteria bacterium]
MTIPSSLSHIVEPVADHLEEFDGFLKAQLKSNAALLDTVIRYILRQRGKRVRPTLVFLAAGMCGSITRRTYVAATMVELLHTATLVHDDVVDSSNERRGMASINAVWKNKIAVLVGDFLLSKGLLIAVNNGEYDFLKITSDAVRRLSEGELLQIQKSRQKTIDEATYFKIISDKTASLISTCCAIGAVSATESEIERNALSQYGELVGLAFQIRDDVLDYTSRTKILGKPVGNDIRDQKITLPLLYACKNAEPSAARAIVRLVKGKKPTDAVVQRVMDFVNTYNGVVDAQAKAQELSDQAKKLLSEFPDSEHKSALIDFSNFVVSRTS